MKDIRKIYNSMVNLKKLFTLCHTESSSHRGRALKYIIFEAKLSYVVVVIILFFIG